MYFLELNDILFLVKSFLKVSNSSFQHLQLRRHFNNSI